MRVYRLVHPRHARTPLDGEGSFRFGGRWNSLGIRIAYASSTISLAQLEFFVNLEKRHLPRGLVVAVADIPEDIIEVLAPRGLPKSWRYVPAPHETREIGDRWVRSGRSAALSVPSVLLPLEAPERNYLINPQHRDFARIKLRKPIPFASDPRLNPRHKPAR